MSIVTVCSEAKTGEEAPSRRKDAAQTASVVSCVAILTVTGLA